MPEPHPFDPAVQDPTCAEEALVRDVYSRLTGKGLTDPAEKLRQGEARSVQVRRAEAYGREYLSSEDGADSEAAQSVLDE